MVGYVFTYLTKKNKKTCEKYLTNFASYGIIKVQKTREVIVMWYKWFWQDGTVTICKGYDKVERASEERQHGKLLYRQACFY
jgi:hypothetical protein